MPIQYMTEKYIDNMVDDIYVIITKRGNWPNEFDADDKIKFLKTIQMFYENKDTQDGYVRCAKIQKMIRIINVYKTRLQSLSSGSLNTSDN